MNSADIVERLLETDALTGNDEGTPTHYTVHADDLEYLVNTIRSILAEKLREEYDVDVRPQGVSMDEWDESNPYNVLKNVVPDAWLVDKPMETFKYGNLIPVNVDGEVRWLMEAKVTFGGIVCIR